MRFCLALRTKAVELNQAADIDSRAWTAKTVERALWSASLKPMVQTDDCTSGASGDSVGNDGKHLSLMRPCKKKKQQ